MKTKAFAKMVINYMCGEHVLGSKAGAKQRFWPARGGVTSEYDNIQCIILKFQ